MRVIGVLLLLVALGAAAWLVLVGLPAAGGGGGGEQRPAERAQAVTADQAKTPGPVATPAPVATPPVDTHEEEDTGPLCDVTHGEDGPVIALPSGEVLRDGTPRDAAAWTWVSLWAAWCKPCIEELPLLERFAASQTGAGKKIQLLFLSIDDDPRQLARFLETKAGANVRARVVRVPEGDARTRLFAALGVDDPPALPVQALLDPAGRLRCLRKGAVGERALGLASDLLR